MIVIILLSLWYLFMITLSYRGIEKIDEVENKWDTLGASFASIIWPITWLIIAMSKGSKIMIDKIVQELEEENNDSRSL